MLYALIRGLRPERVLEIGVRWGGGARIIASALEDSGTGKAVGIDPAPEAFRCRRRELFSRYELMRGYSPQDISKAVERLKAPVDLAIIDAVHTYDHVLADFRGIIPYMAPGGHVLLHDAFHVGINQAVTQVLSEYPDFVDCGFLTRHPETSGEPVAYQGLRLIRTSTLSSHQIICQAFQKHNTKPPDFSATYWNWDAFHNLQLLKQSRSDAKSAGNDGDMSTPAQK